MPAGSLLTRPSQGVDKGFTRPLQGYDLAIPSLGLGKLLVQS